MTKTHIILIIIALILGAIFAGYYFTTRNMNHKIKGQQIGDSIKLPEPKHNSATSIEQALLNRRSVREYKNTPISLAELSQLLWAAQGVSDAKSNYRTTPSAGGLYPLETYVAIINVLDVEPGVYKYIPYKHELQKIKDGKVNRELATSALDQKWVRDGAVIIAITGVYERTTQKYGDRGVRYVHMEAGHAAQNIYLQVVSLNLGTVVVGAFDDAEIQKILGIAENEWPLYLIPIGKR